MIEQAMLMELVASTESIRPDWDDALRRAGYRGRYLPRSEKPFPARQAAVLVAVALAVIYVVSAVAAGSSRGPVYWLFDRSSETYPVLQEPQLGQWTSTLRAGFELVPTLNGLQPTVRSIPVLEGEVAGHRFEMEVYLNDGTVWVGLNPGGPASPYYGTDIPAVAGGGGGFPMHGLRQPDTDDLHWVGWTLYVPGPIEPSGGGTGPKWVYGLAASNVRHVDLEGDHGAVASVPTFGGPSDLGVDVRVWVCVLRLDQLVHTIVPRDASGDALEHWHLPQAE